MEKLHSEEFHNLHTPARSRYGDLIKEVQMGETCSMHNGYEKFKTISVRKPSGK
jgi:hypothetical protein